MIYTRQLRFSEAHERWSEIEKEMRRAYKFGSFLLTTDDLYNSLYQGTEQLWEVSENGEHLGFATTDYHVYPNSNIITRVTSLAGKQFSRWYGEAVKVFEQWSLSIGAVGIEIWGRKGFQPRLKGEGYELKQQLYTKRLK